jgi:hypothetical protein
MKVKEQLQEQRNRLIQKVGLFAANHPRRRPADDAFGNLSHN